MVIRKKLVLFYYFALSMLLVSFFIVNFSGDYTSIIAVLALLVTSYFFITSINHPYISIKRLSIFLVLSVFLIPSFTVAGANFRAEDYLSIFICLSIFSIIFKNTGKIRKITVFILIYLFYSIMITVLNYYFGDIKIIYFLFLLKEIQYFVYFYLLIFAITYVDNLEKIIYKILFILSLANIVWGIIQPVFGISSGFYGIGLINESGSSQSGGVFFIITLFLWFYKSKVRPKYKNFVLLLSLTSAAITMLTISRTAIMALSFSIAIIFIMKYVTILLRGKMRKKDLFITYVVLIILGVFSTQISKIKVFDRVFSRMDRVDSSSSYRLEKWKRLLSESNTLEIIMGKGKGYPQEFSGSLTLGTDSQYVRLVLEVGVIGLIMWLFVISTIIMFAIKNLKRHYHESLFLLLIMLGFCVMGITHEVFLVALQASTLWIMVGLMVGVIIKKNREMSESRHSS